MSTPDKDTQPSFGDKVNTVVASMVQGEDGNWQLPETVDKSDEALIFAVNAERRRRDTQSAFTKTSQENARLKAEANQLAEGWQKDFASSLAPEVQAELEELKITDPDAWRQRLNYLEEERVAKFQEKRTAIQQKAVGESEIEYRQRAFQEFQEQYPTLQLTDDAIKYDIPPRITKELDEGKITFVDYLTKAAEYLSKNRVLKPSEEKPTGGTDLGKAPGASLPDGNAVKIASQNQYKEEIY